MLNIFLGGHLLIQNLDTFRYCWFSSFPDYFLLIVTQSTAFEQIPYPMQLQCVKKVLVFITQNI